MSKFNENPEMYISTSQAKAQIDNGTVSLVWLIERGLISSEQGEQIFDATIGEYSLGIREEIEAALNAA